MANEFYIYLSILTPLIAFFITPLLSSNPNLRDSLGPIGGIITFYSSLNIASLYLKPLQLRIADVIAIGPKDKPKNCYPEIAVIDKQTIIIKPHIIENKN